MGWDFCPSITTKAAAVADRLAGYRDGVRVVKHSLRGNTLWSVLEDTKENNKRIIHCAWLRYGGNDGWGYKTCTESALPYDYSCPLKFLDLVPEVTDETWRKRVRAYHALKTVKLEIGRTYPLLNCRIPAITLTSIKPLRGTYDGGLYRVNRKHLDVGLPTPDSILTPADAARKARLEAGEALRCSALNVGNGRVHVLFRKLDESCVGFYMSKETYDAIPLGTDAAPDEYRKFGHLEPSAADFDHHRSTKEVSFAEFAKDHPEIAAANAA